MDARLKQRKFQSAALSAIHFSWDMGGNGVVKHLEKLTDFFGEGFPDVLSWIHDVKFSDKL